MAEIKEEQPPKDILKMLHDGCVILSYFTEAGIQATEHLRPQLKQEDKDVKSIESEVQRKRNVSTAETA